MGFEIMNSLIKNNDKANDGLKTLRLILENLSDLDLGKLVGEIRKACEGKPNDLKNANCAIFDVSGSLPSNRELEDFVENISRQIELEPADDLWAKMCLTYNFVKAYVERKRQ